MAISESQLNAVQAHLKKELGETIREIEQIDAQVRMYGESGELAEGVDNHIGDDADAVYEQERLLTIRGPLSERKDQIELALSKVDNRNYGICDRCGQPIAPERLEALPFVAYCIQCQEIEDRERDQRR